MNNSKKNTFIFYIFFTLYFVSLFICDLSFSSKVIDVSSKLLKLCSLATMAIYLFMNFSRVKRVETAIIIVFALVLFIASHDMIWIVLAFLCICSKEETSETIFKSSFKILLLLTCITLIGCLLGVIPDVTNLRSTNNVVRHSLGFYHSNVLPIILFYLTVYYCILKENKTKPIVLFMIFLFNIIFFLLCNSKNAFLCTILILVISILTKLKFKVLNRTISFFSKRIMAIFFILSYLFTYLRSKALFINILNVFDKFLNHRIYLSALKYNIFGVHFLNFMDSETFFSIKHTIDNGYIYILLRYGILIAIIYTIINFSFIHVYKNKKSIQLIFIVVAFANFVDNDLFSYGFLPFLIIGINNISLLKERYGKQYERKCSITHNSNI